ncbi:MAG: DUF5677 domain-containing protein [Bacteroidia bacterium]
MIEEETSKQIFIQDLSNRGENFKKHQPQIEIFQEYLNETIKIIENIEILKLEKLPKLVRVVISKVLYSNIELLESIKINLIEKSFTPVEVLSRVSIEYSLNIIYILECENDSRAKGYLNNYIKHHKTKVEKWNDFNVKNSLDMDFSKKVASGFEPMEKLMNDSFDLKSHNWPNARDRFKFCNLENEYLTLFSSASDSIHSGSEDTFNYLQSFVMGDSDIGESVRQLLLFEKMSFSIYMGLNSLRFLLHSLLLLLEKSELNEIFKPIEKIYFKTGVLLKIHDDEIKDI